MNFRNPITNTRTFGSEPERVLKNAQLFSTPPRTRAS